VPEQRDDTGTLYVAASDVAVAMGMVRDVHQRLAQLIERATEFPADHAIPSHAPAVAGDLYSLAASLLRERRARAACFPELSLGEAEWDMMLDLYVHNCRSSPVSVSSACIGSGVPPTTALRHLSCLVDRGVVTREPHPDDARVFLISLTPSFVEQVEQYLTKILAARHLDQSADGAPGQRGR
jgi:DNA-binding MarR family transcriptional regulator